MKLSSLKTEYTVCPLGVDEARPRFSWKIEATTAMQCAYRIIVSSGSKCVWDSGKTEDGHSVAIEFGGTLEARTRYDWSVTVFTDDGDSAQASSYFETGLMSEDLCGAGWIIQNGGADETNAPLMRKSFNVTGKIESARLYSTCAGVYDAYINGQPVSDAVLNPGRSEYNVRIMYQTVDVTTLIHEGLNAVGAVLGRGWYIGACSCYGGIYPSFAAVLCIKLSDGSEQLIFTDESWKYSVLSPFCDNDIFDGEHYDANLEIHGWCEADYDDSGWKNVAVTKREYLGIGVPVTQLSGVVRPMAVVKACKMTEPEKGVYIYDFEQNITGVVRIHAKGKKKQKLIMRHGEILNDAAKDTRGCDGNKGTLYTTNLRSAKATDVYTFRGDREGETYCPRFTYHGFRYVELTGLDYAPELCEVEAVVLYSDMEDTGRLETSDALINRLIKNTYWGQRGNFLSVPTDCPQRDERMGWSGDAQVFCQTACFNADAVTFYQKYITDLNDCLHSNGSYPDVAPGTGRKHYGGSGNSGWGDAGVIIPWVLYVRYHDKHILNKYYDNMCSYIDFLWKTGGDKHIKSNSAYGDWLSIGETTPVGVTDTAYCAYSCSLMTKISAVLGRDSDTDKFSHYEKEFRKAWCKSFLKSDGSTICNTQTSYLVGLAFDIIPAELRERSADCLVKRIEKNGNRIATGFLGANLILPVLCNFGHTDTAFSLLEQRAYPSWLYPVLQGATTIWERWNSYTIENGFESAGMNSFNHYAYGCVVEWMYSYLAGIRCSDKDTAFKVFELKPTFGGSLTYVCASYNSMYGTIKSAWHKENGKIIYTCTVPSNTVAYLTLPNSEEVPLTAGEYSFTI